MTLRTTFVSELYSFIGYEVVPLRDRDLELRSRTPFSYHSLPYYTRHRDRRRRCRSKTPVGPVSTVDAVGRRSFQLPHSTAKTGAVVLVPEEGPDQNTILCRTWRPKSRRGTQGHKIGRTKRSEDPVRNSRTKGEFVKENSGRVGLGRDNECRYLELTL